MLALAAERYRRLQLQDAFDPNNLSTKPTDAQQEIFTDFGTVKRQYVVAGNQCKPAYSLVLMADGSYRPISQVRAGDMVMAFDYKLEACVPSKVLKRWHNGEKEVYRYYFKKHEYTDSTPNHLMPYYNGKAFNKLPIGKSSRLIIAPAITVGKQTVIPEFIALLGYLLGDGCLTKLHSRGVQFTNKNPQIIAKVAELASSFNFKLRDCKNGDFFITPKEPKGRGTNRLINWLVSIGLDGVYAHSKFIPELVFTASLEERCEFVAGLIATDGHVTTRGIGLTTTSEQLARDYQRLLRTLGINSTLSLGASKKEQHKPAWCVEIKSAKYVLQFHRLIKVPGKPAKLPKFKTRKHENKLWSTSEIRKVEYLGIMPVYDLTIEHHDHVYICDGVATSNSGKSQTCSRLTAWVLSETHPHWTRPKEWNQEPLLLVVCGRTGKQLEESIVPRICAYLPDTDYKVVRIGNISQRIEHVNGNRIVFQSLENPQVARERIQSYVAHFAWVDEMPAIVGIIDELIMRINSKNGYFLASFTPLVYNPDIKKMVEAASLPLSKKYKLKMFDNPVYADPNRQAEILASMAHLPDSIRNCRLYGEWMEAESSVWHIDRDLMVETPPNYHPSWRHVEASDPAVSSKFGLSVWAENPATGTWYCIRDDYIEGIAAPDDIVAEVKRRTEGVNLMRRICDPHESWYLGQAAKAGLSYICPKKDGRKDDLIKNLQTALSSGRIKLAPWCTRILDELERAHWSNSDTGRSKIVGGSKLHLCDTSQYFVDLMPARSTEHMALPWHSELRLANEERKSAVKEQAQLKIGKKKRWILRR